MDTSKILAVNLENAKLVANNIYEKLLCPKCNSSKADVYFTKHAQKERYGIWFECNKCGNVEHISCNKRPEGYNINHISEKYQNLDERAWNAEE